MAKTKAPATKTSTSTATARTAGLKPAIKAAASKAAMAAASAEFQAQKPKRVRKVAPAVADALSRPQRGQTAVSTPIDELSYAAVGERKATAALGHGLPYQGLSDTDVGRLVKAFQNAQMPKVNEDKVSESGKATNPILHGLDELNRDVTELRSAFEELENAIGAVLCEDMPVGDSDKCLAAPSGESRVQREIRELRSRLYSTTAWIRSVANRVEL